MTVGLDGRVIRAIDINSELFRLAWKKLPKEVQPEARDVLRSLFFQNIDNIPAKLHFHQLISKEVSSRLDKSKKVKAWSLHITADDRYKASFTYEGGTLYFRTCGKHDTVDKSP